LAEKHPYAATGSITAAINQFRKVFPNTVDAATLRKLSIAPQNESYVINVLRYVGAIDENGAKTSNATTVFNQHDPSAFQKAFGDMVKSAYKELFGLHGDAAWELSLDDLISFFRNSDQTSDIVGRRQASTFQALAALAGHGEVPQPQKSKTTQPKPKGSGKPAGQGKGTADTKVNLNTGGQGGNGAREVGLTVRIEVNLPAAADQETYDKIFRSIRENLINAK
jgi:hypothetical protein